MPKIQFGHVTPPAPASPIPAGRYACQIDRVDRSSTKRGDEMWRLRLTVIDGPHTGRGVQDNLVFSREALPRVKLLCDSLGLDTSGEVDLVPDMIKGGRCLVAVAIEEYQGTSKNKVLYDGYSALSESFNEGEV